MKLCYIRNFLIKSSRSYNIRKSISFNKFNLRLFSSKLKYMFNNGVIKLPHYSKIEKGGEDAYICHEGIICVADGVGGWSEIGVDPAKYSNELCENIKRTFFKKGHMLYHNPIEIFSESALQTLSKGSATCCFCILDLEKEFLHTLNLGDSGYMIIRNKETLSTHSNAALDNILYENKEENNNNNENLQIVYKSEEQQHSFNFPFQVGTNGDNPHSSETKMHKIQENDVIILGTDGLWDNLFDEQILQIIKPFLDVSPTIQDVSLVAEMIGVIAEKHSHNQNYKSPFSVKSKGLYLGGKADDITIIVSQIIKNENKI